MNTAIDNEFYIFDEEENYLKFGQFPVINLYRLNIYLKENNKVVLSVISVERRMKEFCKLECTRIKAVQDLQYVLICASDFDLAHHNMVGNHD